MNCRSIEEVRAAALADHDGPLTQDQADDVTLILGAAQPQGDAA